jgi:hypothetical protein
MRKTASCVGLGIAIASLLVAILAGCGDRPPASTFDPRNNNGPGGNGPSGGGSNGPGGGGMNGPGGGYPGK